MSGSVDAVGIDPGVAALHTALDSLLDRDWTRSTDDEVLDTWAAVETFRNRLATLDHALIAQVRDRHLDSERGATSTVVFARNLLGISLGEAKARVSGAEAAGPRTSLIGELLPPVFEHVAAAQAGGAISPAAAAIVVRTVDKLPGPVQTSEVEAELVGYARTLDVDALAKAAQRLLSCYAEDEALKEADYRERRRDITIRQRPDGSVHGTFEGTAELGEHLHGVFDALAAPAPETDGIKDPRTAGQRRHDALLEALTLLTRAEQLPTSAGVTTTVILTCNLHDWITKTRYTTTSHGGTVPTATAHRWTDAHTRFVLVVLDKAKAVAHVEVGRRLFTEGQRLALIARDRGCSFPGCDRPPQHCQAHHVTDYANGGPTSIDNATLICGYHHRTFRQLGWTCHMHDGHPTWTPPAWMRRGTAA